LPNDNEAGLTAGNGIARDGPHTDKNQRKGSNKFRNQWFLVHSLLLTMVLMMWQLKFLYITLFYSFVNSIIQAL
jgi:hypothetical protein